MGYIVDESHLYELLTTRILNVVPFRKYQLDRNYNLRTHAYNVSLK